MTEMRANRRQRTPLDYVCIGLPLIPIGIVIVVAFWSVTTWTINAKRFEAIKSEVFQNGHPNTVLATDYDRTQDKTHTQELSAIASAAILVQGGLDADFDHYSEQLEPYTEFPPKEYFHEVASQSHQIIERYKRIAPSMPNTWFPIVFAGAATQYSVANNFYGLRTVLACECIDAIHDEENQRAIETLELMLAFTRPESALKFAYSYHQSGQWQSAACAIVNKSLSKHDWTEEELKQLEGLFQKSANLDSEWRSYASETFLPQVQMLLQDVQVGQPHGAGTIRVIKESVFAPSQKIELFDAYQDIANTSRVGLESHSESVGRRQGKDPWSADQFIQLPGFEGSLKPLLLPGYTRMSQTKFNLERFREATRIGLAVKRFKMKHDRFPVSMLELADVGVSSYYPEIYLERAKDSVHVSWKSYSKIHSFEVN